MKKNTKSLDLISKKGVNVNYDMLKNYQAGQRVGRHIFRLVRQGFSGTYNSDDPMVRLSTGAKATGLEQLAWAMGLGILIRSGTASVFEVYGRRTTVAEIAKLCVALTPIDGVSFGRGYRTELDGHSHTFTAQMTQAEIRYRDLTRLKHFVAEHHPAARNFEDTSGEEIVLHQEFDGWLGVGSLFS